MTEPRAVISRLSADFAAISQQLARMSAYLTELDRLLSGQPSAPYATPAMPYWPPVPYPPQYSPPPPLAYGPPPPAPQKLRQERSEGWIGKVLAVAGVAVTLIGVVLLLVLAAQAGILRPEFRVTGGAVLAGALLAAAWWLYARPGGRVGAIALAATGVAGVVRPIWSALSAVSALIAVTVAVDGYIAAPVLLAMAVVVAIAGRRDVIARWVAVGFGVVGGGIFLTYAPPSSLVEGTETSTAAGISTIIASVLLVACAVTIAWSWKGEAVIWTGSAAVIIYAVTAFTVTAGVLIGGVGGGFFAGHVAATICWIAMAAALFVYAARLTKAERSMPIGAGMALVAAAMAKLFLFDLGTLDGIFRVVVFIVVGLVLLGMGAGYARLLEKQDLANLE
jgi:hypothetical protein